MKRRILAASLLAGGLALVPGTAGAKGARSATISGPGLRTPIELSLITSTQPGGVQAPRRPEPNELVSAAGLFVARDSSPAQWSARPPAGRLGPHYVITYHWIIGPGTTTPIHQDLYPLATAGPLTFTPPGQRLAGGQRLPGGWYRAGQRLTDLLNLAGIPAAGAAQTPAPLPRPIDTGPQLAG